MQENRYSRHELLKEVGVEGQKRISQGRVLIIGAGGLGSPASLYLASSGVKKITIVDSDTVDLTNLQRQVIHNVERLGMNKAESAKVSLEAINPEVEIVPVDHRPFFFLSVDIVLQMCYIVFRRSVIPWHRPL